VGKGRRPGARAFLEPEDSLHGKERGGRVGVRDPSPRLRPLPMTRKTGGWCNSPLLEFEHLSIQTRAHTERPRLRNKFFYWEFEQRELAGIPDWGLGDKGVRRVHPLSDKRWCKLVKDRWVCPPLIQPKINHEGR